MTHRVSVIVPTYQRVQELDMLLPTILGQTYPPAELTVVDDTEDTSVKTLCEGYTPQFANAKILLRYMRGSVPRSAARARNLAAEISEGDILLFLDSDVVLDKEYIGGIVSLFHERPAAVGAQGLITNWAEAPLARRFMNEYGAPGSPTYGIASWLARNLLGATVPSANSCRVFEYPTALDQTIECRWLSGSNLSVTRRAFHATGFADDFEGYSLGEDIILSKSLRALGTLYITPTAKCLHAW
jgi:GT2 family glycosyltransferase